MISDTSRKLGMQAVTLDCLSWNCSCFTKCWIIERHLFETESLNSGFFYFRISRKLVYQFSYSLIAECLFLLYFYLNGFIFMSRSVRKWNISEVKKLDYGFNNTFG